MAERRGLTDRADRLRTLLEIRERPDDAPIHLGIRGRTGIRTQERVAPLTVFKTVAFVRSAILPGRLYLRERTDRVADASGLVAPTAPDL